MQRSESNAGIRIRFEKQHLNSEESSTITQIVILIARISFTMPSKTVVSFWN